MARSRRGFLKSVVAGGLASQSAPGVPAAKARATTGAEPAARIDYPRTFTGRQLSLISFPLGGIGAGSLGGTAWGAFRRRTAQASTRFSLVVHGGTPACRSASVGKASGAKPSATLGGEAVARRVEQANGAARFVFETELLLKEGDELVLLL